MNLLVVLLNFLERIHMKNSKAYLQDLYDKFPQLTPRERQLCRHFFECGVNYVLQDQKQIPALFKPKEETDE
jgi:hypothetical protein